MSDTPKTDQIWREYWEQFPQEENRTPTSERIFFGVKLKELERENAMLKNALAMIAELRGPKGERLYEGACQQIASDALSNMKGQP